MAEDIKGYEIVNPEKFERAVHGSVGAGGTLHGGVGENASDAAKLAEYDRMGGLIRKKGYKVKMGSFYDFEKKKPREKPEIVFVFRNLNGVEVEVPEGEDVPLEVQAAELAKKKDKKVKKDIEE